jgi:hypothetical protein
LASFGGYESNDLRNILNPSETVLDDDLDFDDLLELHKSPYFSIDGLTEVMKNEAKNFTVLSLNAQSIRAKIDSLTILVDHILSNGGNPSAILIQETWLDKNSDISTLQLEHYTCITQGFKCSRHAGLMCYLRSDYEYELLDFGNNSDLWESQFIKITGPMLNKPFLVANIYRPPKFNNNSTTILQFLSEFEPIIDAITSLNYMYEVLVCGDYNINLLKINYNESFSKFLDVMLSNNLLPTITMPTRIAAHSCSLIDNIFYKVTENSNNNNIMSGILASDISDHYLCFTSLTLREDKETNIPKFVTTRVQDDKAINKFVCELQNTNIMDQLDKNPDGNADTNYNQFHSLLMNIRDKCLPLKTVKFNRHKHKKSPWVTSGILRSIKFRDSLYLKLKRTHPETETYNNRKHNLKVFNNILKKIIREAKVVYYRNTFSKFKSDIKNTWKTIHGLIIKSKQRKANAPDNFIIDGKLSRNKSYVVRKFNEFFIGIGHETAKNINNNTNKSYQSYLLHKNEHVFNFKDISESHVSKIINNLTTKDSYGIDGISTRLLKLISDPIVQPLCLIINQSMRNGVFPSKLKIAKICPIFKKGDATLFNNYRPISLLPAISKIFEKVVYNQIYQFLKVYNLLFEGQYGFRTQHSTELAALDLADTIYHDLNKNKIPLAIFIDLSKAFDTIDHSILLDKLNFYGIRNNSLKWFSSYLSNRQQFVELHGECSPLTHTSIGVPQGSILGPLLFLIYINDLHQSTNFFKFILYADDTTLVSSIPAHQQHGNIFSEIINSELHKVNEWMACNKLSLNSTKTKCMVFKTKNKNTTNMSLKFQINHKPIDLVSSFNFLGITFDETLNWRSHIQHITLKLSRTIGILKQLKRYLPIYILRTLYCSLIQPHLNYGILTWGTNRNNLEKIQKRAVRTICNAKYNSHSEPLLKSLSLLKLSDLFNQALLVFYYKYCHRKLPIYFQRIGFRTQSSIHSHNTRNNSTLVENRARINLCRNCICHQTTQIVNTTQLEILNKIETHSIYGFTNYLKVQCLSKYSNDCTTENCYVCINAT